MELTTKQHAACASSAARGSSIVTPSSSEACLLPLLTPAASGRARTSSQSAQGMRDSCMGQRETVVGPTFSARLSQQVRVHIQRLSISAAARSIPNRLVPF